MCMVDWPVMPPAIMREQSSIDEVLTVTRRKTSSSTRVKRWKASARSSDPVGKDLDDRVQIACDSEMSPLSPIRLPSYHDAASKGSLSPMSC